MGVDHMTRVKSKQETYVALLSRRTFFFGVVSVGVVPDITRQMYKTSDLNFDYFLIYSGLNSILLT